MSSSSVSRELLYKILLILPRILLAMPPPAVVVDLLQLFWSESMPVAVKFSSDTPAVLPAPGCFIGDMLGPKVDSPAYSDEI